MSHALAKNIKHLRKERGLTQEGLARKLGIGRAVLASYEEGRAEPRLDNLQLLSYYFNCTLDDLIHFDFAGGTYYQAPDKQGRSLRVLSVAVDSDERERILVVPVKAQAGYLEGFSDIDYIGSLPSFTLPIHELGRERTYRLFQIKGDSMNPIPSGSYIISEYVQDWTQIKDDHCYILITKDEGIVYKRVLNRLHEEKLILKSDNPDYKPYSIDSDMLAEAWRAIGYISLELPDAGGESLAANQILSALIRLESDVKDIKSKI